MTEKELLNEARIRYPIGCVVISLYNGERVTIENYDNPYPREIPGSLWVNKNYKIFGNSMPVIYKNGKWATIVDYGKQHYQIY